MTNNLRALDANVSFVSSVGDDEFAQNVRTLLRDERSAMRRLTVADRPTTRKTGWRPNRSLRGWEATAAVGRRSRARGLVGASMRRRARHHLERLCQKAALARRGDALGCGLVLADPKPQNLDLFAGVTCVAPNVHEAAAASGVAIVDDASLEVAGTRLLERLRCRYVVITRGEHGMALFGRDGERFKIPSVARTVFDVSGAGDTVIAVLTLALSAGAPIRQAVQLANFAAAAAVEKPGTATASAAGIIALVTRPW